MKKPNSKTGLISLVLRIIIFTLFLVSCNKEDYLQNVNTSEISNSAVTDGRSPVVPANLEVPPGNHLIYHVYASGVQIYRCTGTSWVFVAPQATFVC